MATRARKPKPLDGDLILQALLRKTLAGQDGHAYPANDWGSDIQKSTLNGDRERVWLTKEDAQPLVDAGLLHYQDSGTLYYRLTADGIRRALPAVDYKPIDVRALMGWVCERALFNPSTAIGGETAIPLIYKPGSSRFVLVLGENAGGKSLVRRVVNKGTHRGLPAQDGDPEIPRGPFPVREFVAISMQFRTRAGMGSVFVFGDEGVRSTGEISARTVANGIKTVSEREHQTIMYWDEPDIGMSAGAAAGAGMMIRNFVENLAPLVEAVFVTSHSPALVRQLVSVDPHYLYVGNADGPKDLDAWFEYQANPKPLLPTELAEISNRRFKQIQAVMNSNPKKKHG